MRPLAVSLGCALWCTVSVVHAEEEPLVLLELERCDELDETEVRRVVAAEIGARPTNARGPEVTQVIVACDDSRVVIQVRDPLSRKAVQRSFNIGLFDPRARSRLVSIAAAELVLASWAELETNPNLHVEPEDPAPREAIKRAARTVVQEREGDYEPTVERWYDTETPNDRMMRVLVVGSGRKFFGSSGALWGGGVRIGEERFRLVSWAADLLVENGEVDTGAQRFDVQSFTVGAALFAYVRSGAVTARFGAGLRLGVASSVAENAAGDPNDGTQLAPWGWPLGSVSFSLRLSRHLVFDLAGEGGYVSLRGPALQGGWFSGQVGLGLVTSAFGGEAPGGASEE